MAVVSVQESLELGDVALCDDQSHLTESLLVQLCADLQWRSDVGVRDDATGMTRVHLPHELDLLGQWQRIVLWILDLGRVDSIGTTALGQVSYLLE